MVAEAWVANIPTDERIKVREWIGTHGSLEDWPKRREIIMVSYCSPSEEIVYTADIIRGRIALIEAWNINQRNVKLNYDDFTTRFQCLFIKSKAGQN